MEAFERGGYWHVRFANEKGVFEIAETVVPADLELPGVGMALGVRDVSIPGPSHTGTGVSSASDSEFGYQDGDFGIFTVTVSATWVDNVLIDVNVESAFNELPPPVDPR